MDVNNYPSSFSETDAAGTAQLTLPGYHGEFQFTMQDWAHPLKWVFKQALLTGEGGFRPNQVAEIKPDAKPEAFQIKDKQGRAAILRGARASLDHGGVLIDFEVVPWETTDIGELAGRIVDRKGQPIAGATVNLVYSLEGIGNWESGVSSMSGADGRFTIKNVLTRGQDKPRDKLGVVVRKDGFCGTESKRLTPSGDPKTPIDFGRISMPPGKSLRIRVLDTNGKPAVGTGSSRAASCVPNFRRPTTMASAWFETFPREGSC